MRKGVSEADLKKLGRRHSDIPQDPLPGVVVAVPKGKGAGTSRKAAEVSTMSAICPDHAPSPKKPNTGLVNVGNDEYVFRDHTKRIGKHVVPCPGSGRIWTTS